MLDVCKEKKFLRKQKNSLVSKQKIILCMYMRKSC